MSKPTCSMGATTASTATRRRPALPLHLVGSDVVISGLSVLSAHVTTAMRTFGALHSARGPREIDDDRVPYRLSAADSMDALLPDSDTIHTALALATQAPSTPEIAIATAAQDDAAPS